MINAIKTQTYLLEDRLWEVAIDCYGLTRSMDTVAAICEAANCGREQFEKTGDFGGGPDDPIDRGLAVCFMVVQWVLTALENDPLEALSDLTFAAECVGVIGVIGGLRKQKSCTATELMGSALGRSLLHEGFSKTCASVMAAKRHAENQHLFDDALKHWRGNIDFNLSAQKAATELTRVVPLSHKKLAEIVSIEKNKTSRLRKTEPERKA